MSPPVSYIILASLEYCSSSNQSIHFWHYYT